LPVPSPHNSADVTTSGVYENSGIGVRIQSERVYENPRYDDIPITRVMPSS
jgi:hypothetical protein